MYKRKPFDTAGLTGNCLIAGDKESCLALRERIKATSETNVKTSRLSQLSGDWDTVFLIDADISVFESSGATAKRVYLMSEETSLGITESQKNLVESDWQALRDVERQLLAMDEAGIWAMPLEVRTRMKQREVLRISVDSEFT